MKILGKIVLGIGGMSCLGYLLRKSEDKLMEEKKKKDKEYTDVVTENATYLDALRQMEKEKEEAIDRVNVLEKDATKLKSENELLQKENTEIKAKMKKPITQLGQKVISWQLKHPQGTKQECSKELQCGITTVKRWWNYYE